MKLAAVSLESRLLQVLAPWRQAPAWRVALSGGLDSTVLLHLLVQLRERESLPPLSALHVAHGLQAAAATWPAHCAELCRRLQVPLQVQSVQVAASASVENAAREARYAAFASQLGAGELLLLAQHADDQIETLLFRLLRGAGVRGLSGMPAQRALGRGHLLRPLLAVSRAELEAYARAHGLTWVEDPSNADCRFSRNFLRQQLLPLLEQRWPAVRRNLLRILTHQQEAGQLLAELAEQDLAAARGASFWSWLALPMLQLAPLQALSEARQRNALRAFLAPLGELPDSAHWAGWQALRDAADDAEPVWRLARGELRRAGGLLCWLSGDWLRPVEADLLWPDPAEPLLLPGNGRLHCQGSPPVGVLRVRYRQGGEVLALAQRGHRDLKRLLNESAVPAFLRGRLPLLFAGEQLLAVANLAHLRAPEAQGCLLLWEPPAGAQGLS